MRGHAGTNGARLCGAPCSIARLVLLKDVPGSLDEDHLGARDQRRTLLRHLPWNLGVQLAVQECHRNGQFAEAATLVVAGLVRDQLIDEDTGVQDLADRPVSYCRAGIGAEPVRHDGGQRSGFLDSRRA